MSKIWFITGASRGLGRSFAEAALAQGDRVVATARHVDGLQGLVDNYGDAVLPLELDVTDKAAVEKAVERAIDHVGPLDVVVNNAGYGLFGAVEEITEHQLRAQLETNLFGVLFVTQAVLPHLRTKGSGHIIQVSTMGGVMAVPLMGGYHASKWALEGLSESLAREVAGFGITVTLVEPGPYGTDWAGSSAVRAAPNGVYDELRERLEARRSGWTPGNPDAAGQALLEIANSDDPPLRVFFGTIAPELVRSAYADRLETWAEWDELAARAQGN